MQVDVTFDDPFDMITKTQSNVSALKVLISTLETYTNYMSPLSFPSVDCSAHVAT